MFALAFVSLIRNLKAWQAVAIVTGLFIVGLMMDSYKFFVPRLAEFIETQPQILLKPRSGLFFGTIYVYLGYVFSRHSFRIKQLQAAAGIVVSLLLLCAEGVLLMKCGGIYENDITLFALPVSAFTFIFVRQQRVKIRLDKLLFARKLSTVLYCVHPIFLIGCKVIDMYFYGISLVGAFTLIVCGSTIVSAIIVQLGEKHKLMSCLA